jgi:hypothetical protein
MLIFNELTSPPCLELATLERRLGEAVVDCAYELAQSMARDDANLPTEKAEEEIKRCKEVLTMLKRCWVAAVISFEDTAYKQAAASRTFTFRGRIKWTRH